METSDELRERAGSGVRWLMAGRLAIQVVSLGFAMVLARLLTPTEFGVFGLAFAIVHIVIYIDAFRVEAALVQLKVADEGALSAAALFGLLFGVCATALLYVAAPLIARVTSVADLAHVLRVTSIVFVVRGLFLVPRALIRRRLLFRAQVTIDVIKVVLAGALAVGAAASGLGVWSLVVYFLARVGIEAVGTTIVISWRPKAPPDRAGLAPLVRFGLPSSGSQLLVYAQQNLTDLFVGTMYGAASLGFYQQAFGLMNKPIAYFDDVVNRLAFPVMSRKFHLEQELTSGYLKAMTIVTAAAAPAACAAAVLAPELVRVVYGLQWVDSIPLLQILAPLGLLKVWQPLISAVFHARGHPSTELVINVVVVGALAGMLWLTRGRGVESAAVVTVGAAMLYSLIGHIAILRAAPATRSRLMATSDGDEATQIQSAPLVAGFTRLLGPAIGCGAIALVAVGVRSLLGDLGDLFVLSVSLGVMAALYAAVLRLVDRTLFADAVAWVRPNRPVPLAASSTEAL